MPYKIGIDARKVQDFGIGTYIRGLVEHLAESRLELDLERSAGEDAPAVEGAEEDEDPRTLRIRAVGPRWRDAEGPGLAEALDAAEGSESEEPSRRPS